MKIVVSITKDDIDNNQRGDCYDCAVARGLIRALGGESISCEIHVMPNDFRLDFFRVGCRPRIRLPVVARRAIERMDSGEEQEPFSFAVTVPDKYAARLKRAE